MIKAGQVRDLQRVKRGSELSEWSRMSVVRSENLDDMSQDGEASGVGMTVKSWSVCRGGRWFHQGELETGKLSFSVPLNIRNMCYCLRQPWRVG